MSEVPTNPLESRRRVVITDRCELIALPVKPLCVVLERILADHDRGGELSVAFIDDEGIAELHGRFLGDATATDVLSFLLDDEPDEISDEAPDDPVGEDSGGPFGEVVVSCETAVREAEKRGLPVSTEAALYAIHGTLHLVGYDDREEADCREMRRQEAHYIEIFTSIASADRDARPTVESGDQTSDDGAKEPSPGLTN